MSHLFPRLLFADEAGRVFEHPELLALVRDGGGAALPGDAPVGLPKHAQLAALPGRRPLGLCPRTGEKVEVREVDLGRRRVRASAVAAVLPPGWTRLALPAYRTQAIAPVLPQWAYTAAAWDLRLGHVAYALRTDRRRHWDPATHSTAELPQLVRERLRRDDNPLLQQLSRCALEWNCFTAQNTFYGRDEGAIPASVGCNARCVGCISEQPPSGPPSSHERMEEAPDARRMAELGIAHLRSATGRTMISFGQGCEGEPLTRARVIAEAIRRMRRATSRGSINVNTNGSLPDDLDRLIDAGLDACRISLNSAHPPLYEAYYRPQGYGFADVARSVRRAKARGVYTALNLLTFPGVTDREGEMEALCELVGSARVDQVQVRSLAIDPEQYLALAERSSAGGPARGMRTLLRRLRSARKGLVIGNFARGLSERT
ncbi:MAG TPA: radical SAM protein [Myxococcales bacterium]|nr:radical SAM protein [Myxococcales bacterium]